MLPAIWSGVTFHQGSAVLIQFWAWPKLDSIQDIQTARAISGLRRVVGGGVPWSDVTRGIVPGHPLTTVLGMFGGHDMSLLLAEPWTGPAICQRLLCSIISGVLCHLAVEDPVAV